MSKFFPTRGSKWIEPKEFNLYKYTSNSSKGCILEVHLQYPKKLHELHNDYTLARGEIEIKREMLSNDQIKISDFYNIPIGTVKKLMRNVFDKEKYGLHYKSFQLYLRLGLKLNKYIVY